VVRRAIDRALLPINTASITQDLSSLNNKVDEVAAPPFVLLPCQACRALLGTHTDSGERPRFA